MPDIRPDTGYPLSGYPANLLSGASLLQFAAKAATAFRRAAEVAHYHRLHIAQDLCDFAQESA